MSDIRTIRQKLKPWPSYDDPKRYYVNDWTERISSELSDYRMTHPKTPSISLLKNVGKVWYDNFGTIHVDGIYSQDLTFFIAKTMADTQFTESEYDPSRNARIIDWPTMIQKIKCERTNGLCIFDYNGRKYRVDEDYLEQQIIFNPAYLGPEGIRFESDSIDLQELVLKCIADNEFNQFDRLNNPDDFHFLSSLADCNGIDLYVQEEKPPVKKMKTCKEKGVPEEPIVRVVEIDRDRMRRQYAREKTQPLSYWSKKEILETCRDAGVAEESISALKKMKLDDIRRWFLVLDSTDITGNMDDFRQQRHTRFWRLDVDKVGKLR